MAILDVTPVFEYWFKKNNGNNYKQPAQIIASIVATGNKKTKNSETKVDTSRRNKAIEIYEKMEKMTEYTYLCSLVNKIIKASKNLQKATLRKYKYVKEMLDLVDKIKVYIPNIVKKFDHHAVDKETSMNDAKTYNMIADKIDGLKIDSVDLGKQIIAGKKLTIKEDKNKFVIEVLAQLGYKNQMKFIGLNRTVKAKEREEKLHEEKKQYSTKLYEKSPDSIVEASDTSEKIRSIKKEADEVIAKLLDAYDKKENLGAIVIDIKDQISKGYQFTSLRISPTITTMKSAVGPGSLATFFEAFLTGIVYNIKDDDVAKIYKKKIKEKLDDMGVSYDIRLIN